MNVSFPTLRAACTAHTVDTARGLVAGYLVRCTTSRRDLGYIWPAGASWRWKTPNGLSFGERSTASRAVETLRDISDLQDTPTGQGPAPMPASPRPLFDGNDPYIRPIKPEAPTVTRPRRPEPEPHHPEPRVAPDSKPDPRMVANLTAGILAAFKRRAE